MYYYQMEGRICCAFREYPELTPAKEEDRKRLSVFLFERDPEKSRASFLVNEPALLFQEEEGAFWLSEKELRLRAENVRKDGREMYHAALDAEVLAAIGERRLRAVNLQWLDPQGARAEGLQSNRREPRAEGLQSNRQEPRAERLRSDQQELRSAQQKSRAEDMRQPDQREPRMKGVQRDLQKPRTESPRPDRRTLLTGNPPLGNGGKKTVHILAIGDVGSNILTGLHLLGGDCIEKIGICDIDERIVERWEFEINQITPPWEYQAMPEVIPVKRENLFDCDVFLFVASAGIPPVDSGVKDVRMYQFEKNARIIADYARRARKAEYRGLFCAVSDPVDPLAKTAFLESNRNENGEFDGRGLLPEQIQSFGLGVMNARAAYYAKRNSKYARFLSEGRAFGPHGQELVIADSIANYDDRISRELTEEVVKANLHMRALGFKPFVAPAYSSAALQILLTLRGEWHYGGVFLGGVYMGVKNRYTPFGQAHEILPLPDALFERIRQAEDALRRIV